MPRNPPSIESIASEAADAAYESNETLLRIEALLIEIRNLLRPVYILNAPSPMTNEQKQSFIEEFQKSWHEHQRTR